MPDSITYPDRVELARLPTPLEHLERTSAALGVQLYVKRDDLTGAELSGNKVRKLEFLLADALHAEADTLITCGGEQSNHCRATALAAVKVGMRAVLLLRTRDPSRPPATAGNILLDRLAGAEIVWVSYAEYANRAALMEREAERLRREGRSPYIIPEGGSNAVGSWGYVRAAHELMRDMADLPPVPTTIVYAAGSGGTGAGLILGVHALGLRARGVRVAGINVCDDRDYFVRTIGGICDAFAARYDLGVEVTPDDIDIIDGHVGAGYAQTRPEELETLRDMARRDAIVLDPVYTGKAFHGLTRELARDPDRFGQRVIFLHSGGIYGLFPVADALLPLL